MATMDFKTAEEANEFFQLLEESPTVELCGEAPEENTKPVIFRIPEVLICTSSHFFDKLFSSNDNSSTTFTYRYRDKCFWQYVDAMRCFIRWLYTGQLFPNGVPFYKLWMFGRMIGAPKFMNRALISLCPQNAEVTLAIPDLRSHIPEQLWKPEYVEMLHSAITSEDNQPCDIPETITVYWHCRKLLRFYVDFWAYVGVDGCRQDALTEELERILHGQNRTLALQIMKQIGAREQSGVNIPPWQETEPMRYLVDEDMSIERLESYSALLEDDAEVDEPDEKQATAK